MFAAYEKYWKHYIDFSGRSSRSDYWLTVLFHVILALVVMFVLNLGISFFNSQFSSDYEFSYMGFFVLLIALFFVSGYLFTLFFIVVLINLIPFCAITVRRLRDAGFHWSFIFLGVVPVLNLLIQGIAVLVNWVSVPLEVVQVINLFVPGITDLANWISVPCGIILIVLLCRKTKWVENSSFVNSQSPQSFGQQPVQNEQFGQPPQQSQEQQNISVQEEQQSTQLTDNPFETKD